MQKKKLFVSVLKKFVIAVVPTLFFGLMALIPPVGYTVQTHLYSMEKHYELAGTSDYIFAVANFNCNASFNPLLYPVSWLSGKGRVQGNFSMIYLPFWTISLTKEGEKYYVPRWGKLKVIESEAAMKVVLETLLGNLPFLFVLFFATELTGRRKIYALFFGGGVGFVFGVLGVVAGLLVVFSTVFLLPKLRKSPRVGNRFL